MQYDHHQNTTERALASEVSVASYKLRVIILIKNYVPNQFFQFKL